MVEPASDLVNMEGVRIPLPMDAIAACCQKWMISELALFGSVLRDDFRPDSDVDVLVSFAPEAHWTLLDFVDMQDEMAAILGREVDLVSRRGIEHSLNIPRRTHVLQSARIVYAAA